MRKHKLSELVLDYNLYPRSQVDDQHCSQMAIAVQNGAELPPIVICRKTKRVSDGFHRITVYRKLYGDDHQVDCIEKAYKSDADLFLDAMRYNAGHGRTLTTHDRARCVLVAATLHIDDDDLAAVLHVNSDFIGELRVDRTATAKGLHVPLKRTIRHMAGHKLTQPQVEANKKLSGMNQLFYVNQLLTLIDSELIDTSNEALMEALTKLHDKLGGLVAVA